MAIAKAIGGTRAGILETQFQGRRKRNRSSLVRQAVLCGGPEWLVKRLSETLVEAGYQARGGLLRMPCTRSGWIVLILIGQGGTHAMAIRFSKPPNTATM